MKLYEIGLGVCGVLGVLYGVGFGLAYDKNRDSPTMKRIATIGPLVLGAVFVVTLILWFLRK